MLLLLKGHSPDALRNEVDFHLAADKEAREFTVGRAGEILQPPMSGPWSVPVISGGVPRVPGNDAIPLIPEAAEIRNWHRRTKGRANYSIGFQVGQGCMHIGPRRRDASVPVLVLA